MARHLARWVLVLGIAGTLAMGATAFAHGHGGGGHGGGHGGGGHGGGGHHGGGGMHHGGGGMGGGGMHHHHGGGGVIIGGGGYYGGFGYPYGYSSYGYPRYYSNYGYNNGYYGYSQPVIVNSAPTVVLARPAPPTPDAMIKISMAAGAGGNVPYKLNDFSYTMQPGFSQKFANDRSWTISFDDGSGKMISQALVPGNYVFVKNDAGMWELRNG